MFNRKSTANISDLHDIEAKNDGLMLENVMAPEHSYVDGGQNGQASSRSSSRFLIGERKIKNNKN